MNDSSIIWFETLFLTPAHTGARESRDFVRTHLTAHGLLLLVDDTRLVVSELVTNALLHALPPVIVNLQEQTGSVLVTVSDTSPALPVGRPPSPTGPGGRGLAIVGRVSDEWG